MKQYLKKIKKLKNYTNLELVKLSLQLIAFFITVGLYQNCEQKSDIQAHKGLSLQHNLSSHAKLNTPLINNIGSIQAE